MIRFVMMQVGVAMLIQGVVGGVLKFFDIRQEWGVVYLIDRYVVDLPELPWWVTWVIAVVGLGLAVPWLLTLVKPLWQAIVNGPGRYQPPPG